MLRYKPERPPMFLYMVKKENRKWGPPAATQYMDTFDRKQYMGNYYWTQTNDIIYYLDFQNYDEESRYIIDHGFLGTNTEKIDEITGKLVTQFPHLISINHIPNEYEKKLARELLPLLWYNETTSPEDWKRNKSFLNTTYQRMIFMGCDFKDGKFIPYNNYEFSINNDNDIDEYLKRVKRLINYFNASKISREMLKTARNISHMQKSYRERMIDWLKTKTSSFVNWTKNSVGLTKLLKIAGRVLLVIIFIQFQFKFKSIVDPSFNYDFISWVQSSDARYFLKGYLKELGGFVISKFIFYLSLDLARIYGQRRPTISEVLKDLSKSEIHH